MFKWKFISSEKILDQIDFWKQTLSQAVRFHLFLIKIFLLVQNNSDYFHNFDTGDIHAIMLQQIIAHVFVSDCRML